MKRPTCLILGILLPAVLGVLPFLLVQKKHNYTRIDGKFMTEQQKASQCPDGFAWYEYSLLGFPLYSEHDWRGIRPAETRGLPGGLWAISGMAVSLGILISVVGSIISTWRQKERPIPD